MEVRRQEVSQSAGSSSQSLGQPVGMASEPEALRCKHHPRVETVLRCGKCDEGICAKCVVITPVGARCRECANLRRLPTFQLSPVTYLRALGAMLGAAALGGALAGLLRGVIPFGGILIPVGLGFLLGEAIALATNRKRATSLKLIAAVGVVLAVALQPLALLLGSPGTASLLALGTASLFATLGSPLGLIGLALGIVVAVNRI